MITFFKKIVLKSFLVLFISVALPIFFVFSISSCEQEKINVRFSRIYIQNISTTNEIDNITNIQTLDYNSATMSSTVSNMESSVTTTRNNGFNNFLTNQTIFPWSTTITNSIAIGNGESYSIFRSDCENSIIIRIENGYTNTSLNEYYKKHSYALLDPIGCGFNHYINITNRNAQ